MNHQKKISKSYAEQVEKINDQIRDLSTQLRSRSITPTKRLKLKNKIKDLKVKKQVKMETKNIAMGTSKISYIDPRITIAFMKANGIPPDKLFTKALMDKFKWAFNVEPDFKF